MSHDPRKRFSIPHPGWLLLAGLVLAVIATGLIVWNRSTLRLVRKVEELGGSVTTKPGGPEWLRRLVGDDKMRLFDRIDYLDLSNTAISDEGLKDYQGLSSLEILHLSAS